jgi:hypothetical protein
MVDAMHADARLVREEWEAVNNSTGEQEIHLARLASALADYFESRSMAYATLRWARSPNELHGPLDAAVLVDARRLVSGRFATLAASLEDLSRRMVARERRTVEVDEIIAREREDPTMLVVYRAEREVLDRVRRRESQRAGAALLAYHHYRGALARIAAASPAVTPRELNPLGIFTLRRLTALSAPALD